MYFCLGVNKVLVFVLVLINRVTTNNEFVVWPSLQILTNVVHKRFVAGEVHSASLSWLSVTGTMIARITTTRDQIAAVSPYKHLGAHVGPTYRI